MRALECRVDGRRVVVHASPSASLREIARRAIDADGRADGIRVEASASGAPATHACVVDGRVTRDLDVALRLLNVSRSGKVEIVASGSVGGEAGGRARARVVARDDARADGRKDAKNDGTIASSGETCRQFRVIRRSTEIEEAPDAPREEADDFYELTTSEASGLIARARREPILMTKKMREAAEAGRVRPTRAVIRFMLPTPSDLVIEALFSAEERVGDLYAFVERCAVGAEAAAKLELFVTPPKVVLARNDGTTLLNAGMAPAARVRIGLKGAATCVSAADAESLFQEDILALVAESRPTVRVVERPPASSASEKAPVDAKTVEEKKKTLMEKLAAGGKPKWLKL